MSETKPSKRGELVRQSVVFQLKLVTDGMRDLVLVPISFIATIIGLITMAARTSGYASPQRSTRLPIRTYPSIHEEVWILQIVVATSP